MGIDGNPIYGPYGFTNGKNASGGVTRQDSGYQLRANRDGLGTLSPPVSAEYPMGTFVEDFTYDPLPVSTFLLAANGDNSVDVEDGDITTQKGFDIAIDTGAVSENGLDETMVRFATPEYPEEIYPDGVFCYFVTSILPATSVLYVGHPFQNRPISAVKYHF